MAKVKTRPQTPLEREADRLTAGGYSIISPDHNAINAILADLGKADLDPREVETLCKTAKVMGIDGFTRIDLLPCGCSRIYKGLALGIDRYPQTISLRVGGVEGVKPCQKHTKLIGGIKL